MQKIKYGLLVVLTFWALGGCAAHAHRHSQPINEFYAWVDAVEPVHLESSVGPNIADGMLHGAISGAHIDGDNALRGAIWGGVLFGLITAVVEGSRRGYEYELADLNGDSVIVVTDSNAAFMGDCVFVRITHAVELYPVAAERCAGNFMQL